MNLPIRALAGLVTAGAAGLGLAGPPALDFLAGGATTNSVATALVLVTNGANAVATDVVWAESSDLGTNAPPRAPATNLPPSKAQAKPKAP